MTRRLPARTSVRGVEFIASFEGLRLMPYKAHKSERHWTVGFGHYGPDVNPVKRITKAQALELLRGDLRRFEQAVIRHVPRRWRRQQRQFDALVSISFNLGEEVLTAGPPLESLGQALRARLPIPRNARRVAAAIRLYHFAGGESLLGLVRRRNAEARLYRTGNYSTS